MCTGLEPREHTKRFGASNHPGYLGASVGCEYPTRHISWPMRATSRNPSVLSALVLMTSHLKSLFQLSQCHNQNSREAEAAGCQGGWIGLVSPGCITQEFLGERSPSRIKPYIAITVVFVSRLRWVGRTPYAMRKAASSSYYVNS